MQTRHNILFLGIAALLGGTASAQAVDLYSSSFAATGHPGAFAGVTGQGHTYGSWVDTGLGGTGTTTFLDNAALGLITAQAPFSDFNDVTYGRFESAQAWDNGLIMSGTAADAFSLSITFHDNGEWGGGALPPALLDEFYIGSVTGGSLTQVAQITPEPVFENVANGGVKVTWNHQFASEQTDIVWFWDNSPFDPNEPPFANGYPRPNVETGITCMNGIGHLETLAMNLGGGPQGGTAVPEPATYGLLGALSLGLAVLGRRFRRTR